METNIEKVSDAVPSKKFNSCLSYCSFSLAIPCGLQASFSEICTLLRLNNQH